jgi:hypothetical protein
MTEQESMVQKIKQKIDAFGKEMERFYKQADELAKSREELSRKRTHMQQESEKQQSLDRDFQKGALALFKQMQEFYQQTILGAIDKLQQQPPAMSAADSEPIDIEELPVEPKKTVLMPAIHAGTPAEGVSGDSRTRPAAADEEIDIFEIGK